MRRTGAVLVAAGLVCGAFFACTTFDGLTVPARPKDAAPDDTTAPDAAPKLATYLPVEDAARLCALVASCPQLRPSLLYSVAVPLDKINFSLCVDWLAGPIPPSHVGISIQATTLSCAAKAKSCQEALNCLWYETLDDLDPRCMNVPDGGADAGFGFYQRCDNAGAAVVQCAPGYFHVVYHCQTAYFAPGSKCLKGAVDGTLDCAVGTDCPLSSCSGNVFDFCGANGLHYAVNCGSSGYTCGVDVTKEAGTPACLTSDRVKPCSSQGDDCQGDVVSVCDGYNRSEFDCATMGASCSKAGGTARCKRPSDECAPDDQNVNQCSGTTISLCVGGKKTTFDCASIGLSCIGATASQPGRCG